MIADPHERSNRREGLRERTAGERLTGPVGDLGRLAAPEGRLPAGDDGGLAPADADPLGVGAYLHEHIPLARHLGVTVVAAAGDGVRLGAPLDPNLNHLGTGFGGSVSAVAILAAWSLVWVRLHGRARRHDIVIQRNSIEYLAPVTGDFTAVCVGPGQKAWDRLVRGLDGHGRGRVVLEVEVRCGDVLAATFTGSYVVLLGG